MAYPVVELRPQMGVDGYGADQDTVVLEPPAHFAEAPPIVLHVLDHIERADEIEFLIAEWQRVDPARHGESATGVQPLDHRRADVDEMRAGNRQPGPQA